MYRSEGPHDPRRQIPPDDIGLVEEPGEEPHGPEGPSLRDQELSERPGSARTGKWIMRAGFVFVVLALLSMIVPAVLVLLPARGGDVAGNPARQGLKEARVLDVIDGATIQVEINGKPYAVRYLGVELAAPGDVWRVYAGAANRDWVAGKTVLLEKDVTDVDELGRLLRYVWIDDVMVNAALIAVGLARHAEQPPDTRYSPILNQYESNARAEKVGIWQTRGA